MSLLSADSAASILTAIEPYTMVPRSGMLFAMAKALQAIELTDGDFVEAGCWRGGCALAMLMVQHAVYGKIRRRVHLLDGFTGLPPATERDGPAAHAWQNDKDSPTYYNNCSATREEVERELKAHGFVSGEYAIWAGDFDRTLPQFAATVPSVSLLRIDCDWYNSVKACLEYMTPLVNPGGTVVLDDYYAWDGCARAAHEYLASHDKPYRIRSLPDGSAAYFEIPR